MPMGRRFLMARRTRRSLNTVLPSNLMSPTLTFGPSSTLNTMFRDDGGNGCSSGVTVANCRPRSAR